VTSPPAETQAAVLAAYQQQTTALRDQLIAYIVALWASFPEYRLPQQHEFATQAVPVVEGAMAHMQSLTSGYLATLAGLAGASSTPTATAVLGISAVRNGADAAEVYRRPFNLVWRQLHDLQPLDQAKIDEAIASGRKRAVQTAATDLQLAKTQTSRDALRATRHVVGYRRVLEGPHSCALCIVAATQRYHKATLLPIHPGCDCSVLPIYGDADPGQTISAVLNHNGKLVPISDLVDVHDRIDQRFGRSSSAARDIGLGLPKYRDAIIVHDHGELGPVIAVRGRPFTARTPQPPSQPPSVPPIPTPASKLPKNLPPSTYSLADLANFHAALPTLDARDLFETAAGVRGQDAAVLRLITDEIDRRRAQIDPAFEQSLPAKPAGLVQRGLDTREHDAKAVNPDYGTGLAQWRNNCTNCTTAYELRRRGYASRAEARPRGRDWHQTPADWLARPGQNRRQSWSDAEAQIIGFGDGARGAISVQWINPGAHIFNWEVVNGAIVWTDAQPGIVDDGINGAFIDSYKRKSRNSVAIFRLDDLPVDQVLGGYLR
jgi:hypothetical protein